MLRPGGQLILTAPFCSLTHFAPFHYYSGFNRYFYEIHLPRLGFEMIDIKHNGNFFEYLAQEVRRIKFVADRYSGIKINFFVKVFLQLFLLMLSRYSRKDRGSEEILNFGYHVRAIKSGELRMIPIQIRIGKPGAKACEQP